MGTESLSSRLHRNLHPSRMPWPRMPAWRGLRYLHGATPAGHAPYRACTVAIKCLRSAAIPPRCKAPAGARGNPTVPWHGSTCSPRTVNMWEPCGADHLLPSRLCSWFPAERHGDSGSPSTPLPWWASLSTWLGVQDPRGWPLEAYRPGHP